MGAEAKLLYSTSMSLDGFIAGPGGDMSWLGELLADWEPDPEVIALPDLIGSLLIGRRTFTGDDPNAGTEQEGPYHGRWQGRSVVLTHHPDDIAPAPDVTVATDLHDAVAIARAAAGEKYVNVLGADVARQCIAGGLLDEVLVLIAPMLLGDGVRLFEHPGGTRVRLEPVEPGRAGTLQHWYRIVR